MLHDGKCDLGDHRTGREFLRHCIQSFISNYLFKGYKKSSTPTPLTHHSHRRSIKRPYNRTQVNSREDKGAINALSLWWWVSIRLIDTEMTLSKRLLFCARGRQKPSFFANLTLQKNPFLTPSLGIGLILIIWASPSSQALNRFVRSRRSTSTLHSNSHF